MLGHMKKRGFAYRPAQEEKEAKVQPSLPQFECEPVEADPIINTGPRIWEIDPDGCRWPIGTDDDGRYRFCGCQQAGDMKHPYCSEHRNQALSGVVIEAAALGRALILESEDASNLLDLEADEYLRSGLFSSELKIRIGDEGF